MKKSLFLLLMLLLYTAPAMGEVVINEVMALNGYYEHGEAYDWIELYNDGSSTVDLSGWYLSDSKKNLTKWSFPSGTKLKKNAYLVVFCTDGKMHEAGSGDAFYAPFGISAKGEKLWLSDDAENLIQMVELPAQYGCISWGRAEGSGEYGFLKEITRGKRNGKTVYAERVGTPAIETAGGFYSGATTVTAHAAQDGDTLRYTLDGSEPGEKSRLFPAGGLTLKKTSTLRIRAFRENAVPSATVSGTYLIGDTQQTPIVSLITDDKYLFNKKTGSLVKGNGSIPNFDKGWEYPVNIEYFNCDGVCEINQIGTFSISGHSATINSQKSIALFARKAWGTETFAFNPFSRRDYPEYKSILLRAANSDTHATRLRDVVASSLAAGQDIYYQDYQVIQVYINGEYWGHYNLREKINKYSIAQFEGITDKDVIDQIDILARTGTDRYVQNGSNTDWLALCDFCKTKDLNDPANLALVEEQIDIDNLFTHAAYQIILGNVDFTNVRVYRIPGEKWRYVLFDVEACWRGLDKTPLEYYIKPVSGKIQGFRHEPLNALLAVPEMKARFLTRVADLLVNVFNWPNVESAFDEVIGPLEPILPRHIARWKNMKLDNWKKNISATKYYARVRPKKIPGLLQTAMKLTDREVEQYFGEALRSLEETNTIR